MKNSQKKKKEQIKKVISIKQPIKNSSINNLLFGINRKLLKNKTENNNKESLIKIRKKVSI